MILIKRYLKNKNKSYFIFFIAKYMFYRGMKFIDLGRKKRLG